MTFSPLDSSLLGPLFRTSEMKACFSDEAVIRTMVQVEVALARAQAHCGLVPDRLAGAVEIAAQGLSLEALGLETAIAGVPTIPFVNAIRERLDDELAGSFHHAATTQDIVDTALMLRVRPALDLIAAELDAIVSGLIALAQRHRTTPCVGRTYGQHAAPISFGFKVAVWLTGVCEVRDALPALRHRVLVASLGGPVGTLASLGESGPVVLDAFAALLELGTTPLAWHTLRSRIAELGFWLLQVLGVLAKIGSDVLSLSSTDVGEVAEPHVPGRGGSSSMPHKRNPVSSTIILAAHTAAQAFASTLASIIVASHERPAGPWHAEWIVLPQLFGLTSGALREAHALSDGLQVNTARMSSNIDITKGLLFADVALEYLSSTIGRKSACEQIEAAIAEVYRTGDSFQDVLARRLAEGFPLASIFTLQRSIEISVLWIDQAIAAAGA